MSKEKTEEKPEPSVEVGVLVFRDAYDGWGVQGTVSALTSSKVRRESKHTIRWFPRLRVFEVTHHPRGEDYVQIDMVPETSVKRWRRLSDCQDLVR
jgi:hypothetical protein